MWRNDITCPSNKPLEAVDVAGGQREVSQNVRGLVYGSGKAVAPSVSYQPRLCCFRQLVSCSF